MTPRKDELAGTGGLLRRFFEVVDAVSEGPVPLAIRAVQVTVTLKVTVT